MPRQPVSCKRTSTALAAIVISFLAGVPVAGAAPAALPVISQSNGGGGDAGAQFQNDFIEVFNRAGSTASLAGWSVQYAPAQSANWTVVPLSGTLAIGQYFLIRQGNAGTTAGVPLPPADANGTTNMNAVAGKVALVSNTTPLSGACPTGAQIIDFVGYGTAASGANCFEGSSAAPTTSNTTGATRRGAGCTDTNQNGADFQALAPTPRNTASTRNPCFPIPAAPTLTATKQSSPGNTKTPRVVGIADPGTSIEIYTNSTCSGAPVGSGTAAALAAPGITASASAEATLYALAFDANNTSACSSSGLTYKALQILDLRLTPKRFAVGPKPTALGATSAAGEGTRIRFSLTKRAKVAFKVRYQPFRPHPPPPGGPPLKTFGRALDAGKNSVAFSGRLGERVFGPGRYRVYAFARSKAGEVTKVVSAPFTIVS